MPGLTPGILPFKNKIKMKYLSEELPKNTIPVLGIVRALNGSFIPCIVQYTEGGEIPVDEDYLPAKPTVFK